MEFDETRWSYSWNSDQNLHKTLSGVVGLGRSMGGRGSRGQESGVGGGLFDMKLKLSV